MKNIVGEINEASITLGSPSKELTQSAVDVNIGSEQISATIEEIGTEEKTQAIYARMLSSNVENFTKHSIQTSPRL